VTRGSAARAGYRPISQSLASPLCGVWGPIHGLERGRQAPLSILDAESARKVFARRLFSGPRWASARMPYPSIRNIAIARARFVRFPRSVGKIDTPRAGATAHRVPPSLRRPTGAAGSLQASGCVYGLVASSPLFRVEILRAKARPFDETFPFFQARRPSSLVPPLRSFSADPTMRSRPAWADAAMSGVFQK